MWILTNDSSVGNGGMIRMAAMAMVMAMGGLSRSDVSLSPAAIKRRRSWIAAVPANSRVPSRDPHMHNNNNNTMMMMTTMTTIGLLSLTLHGRGWVGCKTG